MCNTVIKTLNGILINLKKCCDRLFNLSFWIVLNSSGMIRSGRGFIGYPKGRNRDIKLVNLSCLRARHINMFKNEEYSSFLNIFTKN